MSGAALYRALELYGRNVDENKLAFDWGRFAAESPEQVDRLANARDVATAPATALPDVIARRVEFLTAYQDRAYAGRYRTRVERIAALEARVRPASRELQEAVARNYFNVLAYKDEYEVARLHTAPEFVDSIRRSFGTSSSHELQLLATAVRAARSGHGPAEEVRVRAMDRTRAAGAGPAQRDPRNLARPVPLRR